MQDTEEQNVAPSHTATATVILEVQPADLRPPWFLPCAYSDTYVCIQAEYHGAVPTGHTLVLGAGRGRMGTGGVAWVPSLVVVFMWTSLRKPVAPNPGWGDVNSLSDLGGRAQAQLSWGGARQPLETQRVVAWRGHGGAPGGSRLSDRLTVPSGPRESP